MKKVAISYASPSHFGSQKAYQRRKCLNYITEALVFNQNISFYGGQISAGIYFRV